MADLQHLFQLGQQVQGRLDQVRHDLEGRMVEVSAGAGMVRVTVDGRGRLRSLVVSPEAFEGRDAELLSDLVLSAVAEAQRRADLLATDTWRQLQPAPGIPGIPGL